MLHELLLALVGCTGDVFIDEKEREGSMGFPFSSQDGTAERSEWNESGGEEMIAGECSFRLAPDLTFLQDSEREILEHLLHLGFYYRELERFSLQSRNLSWIAFHYGDSSPKPEKPHPSVYRRALANGIAEVLAIYRSAVLKVEQNFLSDPVPVLATVTHGLNQFEVLLPPLHALILEVERDGLCGGCLLNLLHAKCHCGLPELQSCLQRLLWHGHQVMYQQLAAWMVYGLLQDQHEEFFIRRRNDGEKQQMSSETEVMEDGLEAGLIGNVDLLDWHTGFYVCVNMLPEYIQLQVAESILFVGKAMRVLRNPSKAFKNQMAACQLQGMESYREPELLPQSEADKISSAIQDLKDMPEFHKRSFETTVDSIRTIAATHLWQLVVVHADLIGHLKALKDYFLLAKGDFFQCFLEESRLLMSLPPRLSSAEADLKVPFQQAAMKTISDDDKYFSRVSLRMPSLANAASASTYHGEISKQRSNAEGNLGLSTNIYGDSISGPSYDGWDEIALEYSIDWPLQLLFTPEVLSKYCRVFQYLLRLKRIQLELEKSWAEAMHQDHADSTSHRRDVAASAVAKQRQQQRMPMWRVRHHMSYLITNLQFYIQVDVIESQWNLLDERVDASKDFTELVRFHQEYLSALISQSFLDIGSVSRILDSIIKLCLQLCRLIEQQEGTPNPTELEQISEEFNKKSNSLYTILRSSKLAGSQRAPFLRQFLLRLNYNSFFEATARGALNVARSRSTTISMNT
eukprot:c20720_g1_i2 orf=155-2389(-)